MGYKLIETLGPLVAPSLRSGRYSFRALWSLFNLYSLSNYHIAHGEESGDETTVDHVRTTRPFRPRARACCVW